MKEKKTIRKIQLTYKIPTFAPCIISERNINTIFRSKLFYYLDLNVEAEVQIFNGF